MDTPIRGSCLCGAVRFEISGAPLSLSYCHCQRCLKVAGATGNLGVRAEDFRFVAGRELVTRYEPEPPFELIRCFCSRCGSYLGEPETHPKLFPIAASALDDDPRVRPLLHEHVADKAPWYEIHDDLPQYPGAPPLSAFAPGPEAED